MEADLFDSDWRSLIRHHFTALQRANVIPYSAADRSAKPFSAAR